MFNIKKKKIIIILLNFKFKLIKYCFSCIVIKLNVRVNYLIKKTILNNLYLLASSLYL